MERIDLDVCASEEGTSKALTSVVANASWGKR